MLLASVTSIVYEIVYIVMDFWSELCLVVDLAEWKLIKKKKMNMRIGNADITCMAVDGLISCHTWTRCRFCGSGPGVCYTTFGSRIRCFLFCLLFYSNYCK